MQDQEIKIKRTLEHVSYRYMVLNANVSEVAEYEPFSMGKEKLDIDSSDHLYMTCTGM
jgi:hypothetical protein